MNYIHEIDYKVKDSAIDGVDSKELYNAVIEISNGDNVKYEVHPSGKYLTAVRALNSIFRYPFSYGYIPQTLSEDGDGLDVIVITPEPLAHLSVVEVRILGYVPTMDRGVADNKVIAVPAYSKLKKVALDKVTAFLKNYKYPENEPDAVGDFISNSQDAILLIEDAHKRYTDNNSVAPSLPVEEKAVVSHSEHQAELKSVSERLLEKVSAVQDAFIAPVKEPVGLTITDAIEKTTPYSAEIETSAVDSANSTVGSIEPQKAQVNSPVLLEDTFEDAQEKEIKKSDSGWLT